MDISASDCGYRTSGAVADDLWYRDAAEIGGLMSYGPDLVDLFKRGVGYVAKIIKGTQPSDLPIQLPTKFELIINLKTAKALELAIPPALLVRADHTIE
ncbi:MAG: hypothetical protein JO320_01465 [Alphaproteobacteria bacterium]|nr:hypothetical protein [Alphaproteobacteria bacterium]